MSKILKKSNQPQIMFPKLMKQLISACTFVLFFATTCVAQNKTYNFTNMGPYAPNLNEEWVIVQPHGDTLVGYWIADTFFQDNNIHSYVFRDSGIETRWNLCQPPDDVIFKTQFGIPYAADYWSFRKTSQGVYLLGFIATESGGELRVEVAVQNVRYDPKNQRITLYQNGVKGIIRNPIDKSALK